MKNKIAIIGLGYVGLPLAIEFGKKFQTIGYDINFNRIFNLNKKIDINNEISKKEFIQSKNLIFTKKIQDIKNCNYYIVTVPTPVNTNNKPDLKLIKRACQDIGKILKKNKTIIFESTFYPGLTEEICVPILEKFSNLKFKKDFHCGYSPERINPGDKKNKLINIKKIVSGSSNSVTNKIFNLYSSIINAEVIKVSSIKVAEAAKVIENAQRDLNIAYINELVQIFDKLNIDAEETLFAASTKWNFLNFKPGFVGGHCISVDPYYLTYKASVAGYKSNLILSGRKTNDNMHKFVVNKLINYLKASKISTNSKRILIMGYTFKENCSDYRNTKIRDLYLLLSKKFKKRVFVYEPLIKTESEKNIKDIKFVQKLQNYNYDIIILSVGHNYIKKMGIHAIRKLCRKNKGIIFDLKYIFNKDKTDIRL